MNEKLQKTINLILRIWFLYIPAFVAVIFLIFVISGAYDEAREKSMAHERILKRK